MPERIVYLNGQYLTEGDARISIFDRALLYGDCVYDVTRTFGGRAFRLHEHVERLYRSLRYARITVPLRPDEMERISCEVLERNVGGVEPADDLLVAQRVTRGLRLPADYSVANPGATVIVYCEPIPFAQYADSYREGAHLVTASLRRVPPSCLSTQAKIANKMTLILGELEARERDAKAYALFLDLQGFVAESTSSNVFAVRGGRILTPRRQGILEGVSRDTVVALAESTGSLVGEDDLTLYDFMNADEVFLTATTFCVLPITAVDGVQIGDGTPGPITRQLLESWSRQVGMDIVGQAVAHAGRERKRGMR